MAPIPFVSIGASTEGGRALFCIFCCSRLETADSNKLHEPAMACNLLDVRQVDILQKITLALGVMFPKPIFQERRGGKLTTRRQLQYSDRSHNLNRLKGRKKIRPRLTIRRSNNIPDARNNAAFAISVVIVLSMLISIKSKVTVGLTLSYAKSSQRIELANFPCSTTRASVVKSVACHPCFNKTRADGVHADVCLLKLIGRGLCH